MAEPNEQEREQWSSPIAFLFAIGAAAIGLGTLWRFPYVAGANGGGAFVLIYMLFMGLICVPLVIAEMAIGRQGGGSAKHSIGQLIAAAKASPFWNIIATLSLVIPFFGLSYYSIVAGWAISYSVEAAAHGFAGYDAASAKSTFDALTSSPWRSGFFQALTVGGAALVVALGVRRGIEVLSRIKIVALFAILLILVVFNAILIGLAPSLNYLLRPDFSEIGAGAILTALGQALFSTAIGVGVLVTYSAYVPAGVSLPRAALSLASSIVVVAILTGLAVFPVVLAYGLQPAEGPNLIFVTLPIVMGQIPGGRLVAIAFFCLIALGAFTTSVGMLEPVVSWLKERTRLGRAPLAALVGLATLAVGLPSLLSFGPLKGWHPLQAVGFPDKTVFDLLDYFIANILLPLNALLIALFAGWVCNRQLGAAATDLAAPALRVWRILLRYLVPAAIVGLAIHLLIA